MKSPIKELWHGNIIPQEDTRTALSFRPKDRGLRKNGEILPYAGNLINIHYAFQLPEQDGMPVLKMLLPCNVRETT